MGKKIDRFVLTVVLAIGFYLYFYNAYKNHVLAIALALAACFLLFRLFNILSGRLAKCAWLQKRQIRRSTSGVVMKLACMPEEEALTDLDALLNKCYGENYSVELVQMHPSLLLPEQQVFEIWKSYQGLDQLVVCATCPADASCRMLASGLKAPQIALIDAPALEQMIAEHPEGMLACEVPEIHRKIQRKRFAHLLINRRNAPKNLLLSVSMLAMYFLTANVVYLFAALGLMFVALLSLRKNSRPAKLF